MRTISKRAEPTALTQWRAANQADPHGSGINFGYDALRQNKAVAQEVIESLLAEQGSICAYTGRRIETTSSHIEHVIPQAHCDPGEDVDYRNLVACWPQPNGPRGDFGAHPKGSWPARDERALFVSPLSQDSEQRFKFKQRGEIEAAQNNDHAAETTIDRLKLDHKLLTALRAAEIDGVLGKTRNLPLKRARSRLRDLIEKETKLREGGSVRLDPFCFATKQALRKHIAAAEKARNYGGTSSR